MHHTPSELKDEERTRCEVWTRVMGYHRPVSAWNPGKQAEHAQRRYFVEPPTATHARRVAQPSCETCRDGLQHPRLILPPSEQS